MERKHAALVERPGVTLARRFIRLGASTLAALVIWSCSSGGETGGPPASSPTSVAVSTFTIRAVNGSPDAGAVDVYVYTTTGSQPATPIVANLAYPGISAYVPLPTGPYTVSVDRAGTTVQLLTEQLSNTSVAGAQETVVLGGEAGQSTLTFDNFSEPAVTAGTSALLFHIASPVLQAQLPNVGGGVYTAASSAAPAAAATTQIFDFEPPATVNGVSPTAAPATDASVVGGEFYAEPIPATYPASLGLAVGTPSTAGTALASVSAYATLGGLAATLNATGSGDPKLAQMLAADTANTVPSGGHISVFAVDSITSSPSILIGTLDP